MRFASPANFKSMIAGGNEVASLFIQPHVGGDSALITGIAKYLIDNGNVNADYIEKYCDGYEAYIKFIDSLTWAVIERESGVEKSEIQQIGAIYAKPNKTVFSWGCLLYTSDAADE